MELREALSELGPEKVRRGMKCFDDDCGVCFVQAMVGVVGYTRAMGDAPVSGVERYTHRALQPQHVAARLCEAYYERWPQHIPETCADSRATLRDTCLVFLAEMGSHPEMAPKTEAGCVV